MKKAHIEEGKKLERQKIDARHKLMREMELAGRTLSQRHKNYAADLSHSHSMSLSANSLSGVRPARSVPMLPVLPEANRGLATLTERPIRSGLSPRSSAASLAFSLNPKSSAFNQSFSFPSLSSTARI